MANSYISYSFADDIVSKSLVNKTRSFLMKSTCLMTWWVPQSPC